MPLLCSVIILSFTIFIFFSIPFLFLITVHTSHLFYLIGCAQQDSKKQKIYLDTNCTLCRSNRTSTFSQRVHRITQFRLLVLCPFLYTQGSSKYIPIEIHIICKFLCHIWPVLMESIDGSLTFLSLTLGSHQHIFPFLEHITT